LLQRLKYNAAMEFIQTYETTIVSPKTDLSATVLVIPVRTLGFDFESRSNKIEYATTLLGFPDVLLPEPTEAPLLSIGEVARLLRPVNHRVGDLPISANELEFAGYVANAPIVPFEHSPLGADSLINIAANAAKVGSLGVGASVGLVAGGHTPYILITVPLGIVLCGASFSLAKWLEENRNFIWSRLVYGEVVATDSAPQRGQLGRLP
jgi:hypothetical protein